MLMVAEHHTERESHRAEVWENTDDSLLHRTATAQKTHIPAVLEPQIEKSNS